MPTTPTLTLNDGNTIPVIGFGTYPLKGDEAEEAVRSALGLGYRLIDSAANYDNEEPVGRALAESGVPREELFITTKLPGRDHGHESTLRSFEASRARLGLEYVDCYLIHWPNPGRDRYVDSWRAMIELQQDGLVRSIGVSNFTESFIQRLIDETGVTPALNQIELHPHFGQPEMRAADERFGVRTQAWSPLSRVREILGEPDLIRIAADHGVTVSQVVLRWHIENGVVPIPKSANPDRQRENLDVFGFELNKAEITAIDALDRGDTGRRGGNPETFEAM